MATYKITELLKCLNEVITDGYEYVDILECEDNSLSLSAYENTLESIDYENIPSCDLPDDYDVETTPCIFNVNDLCGDILFTYRELFTIMYALDNSLEYFKECAKDPSCSKEEAAEIKESSVDCRNLQAKLAKFHKRLTVS